MGWRLLLVTHWIGGMVWVGGVMFTGLALFPAVARLPRPWQPRVYRTVMRRAHPVLTAAGALVVGTGIWLGGVSGMARVWPPWADGDTLVWAVAAVVGLLTLAWGSLVSYRAADRLFADEAVWRAAEAGDPGPLRRGLARVAAYEGVEVAGFVVLIGCMAWFAA
ncbi:hypothetical protein [Alicyclobacillus sp.]|uniref:hypothetical protein n=1 Tax=Alicyclobacillus sp. TaxID=61169 RepID=UPI0025B9D8F9|nr:hypothetical protein [Alicyclobacillus sp.]MCL6517953.1 hypothetical protein [Alicyclobacillus sp.]